MFRTSNPALTRSNVFTPAQSWEDLERQGRAAGTPGAASHSAAIPGTDAPVASRSAAAASDKVMTLQGTVNKTAILLTLCVTTALVGWNVTTSADPAVSPGLLMMGGMLSGLVLSLICAFAPRTAPVTAPLYALAQGLFVGGISAVYAARFATTKPDAGAVALNTNLVLGAGVLTFSILGALLLGYSTGLVRPGKWFRSAVIVGTMGACLFGLAAVLSNVFFGFGSLIALYDPSNGGLVSVGFSLLLVALASSNLVLDFELIHDGVKSRAPRSMEWYGGFALLVTLIWLYIEVLRLLAKLRSANN